MCGCVCGGGGGGGGVMIIHARNVIHVRNDCSCAKRQQCKIWHKTLAGGESGLKAKGSQIQEVGGGEGKELDRRLNLPPLESILTLLAEVIFDNRFEVDRAME